MADEPIQDEPPAAEIPQGRRRPRLTRLAPDVQGADREALSLWMKAQLEQVEQEHRERIELLRHGKEHPNPAFERIVRNHAIVGTQKSTLAKLLGISLSTLSTAYGEVYEIASAEIMAKIGANLIQKAMSTTDPDAARLGMQILERRGGEEWRAPIKRVEMDKKTDQAPVIDSSKLTFEERQALREMLERVANGGEGDAVDESEQEA
jgi:hypothetical protein